MYQNAQQKQLFSTQITSTVFKQPIMNKQHIIRDKQQPIMDKQHITRRDEILCAREHISEEIQICLKICQRFT